MKKFLLEFLRTNSKKYTRHYLWPARLHSRMANFDIHYSDYNRHSFEFRNLNIGAGPYFKHEHWAVVDFLPDFKNKPKQGIFHQDLSENPDSLPLSDLDNIYSSHTFEHFEQSVAQRLFISCYNALKDGGTLRVLVPDANFVLNSVRENELERFWIFSSYFGRHQHEISATDWAFFLLKTNWTRLQIRGGKNPQFNQNLYDKFATDLGQKNNVDICEWLNQLPSTQNGTGSFHLTSYTPEIMEDMLKKAGFKNVYQSSFMKSKSSVMQQVPLFDGTHPWLTMYFEAKK